MPDETPKRKARYEELFAKSYPDYSKQQSEEEQDDTYYMYMRERGGCLTVFMILQFISASSLTVFLCRMLSQEFLRSDSVLFSPFSYIIVGLVVLRIPALVKVWGWSKIAYYNLIGLYALSIIIYLNGFIFSLAIGTGIELGIFYYLTRDRQPYFT